MRCLRRLSRALLLCAALMVAACAPHVKQVQLDAPLVRAEGFRLTADATCFIGTGYRRVLRAGTSWLLYGEIVQGQVFRRPDQARRSM